VLHHPDYNAYAVEYCMYVVRMYMVRCVDQEKKDYTVEAGCFASAQVVIPNSQQISCLDGSFLECLLSMREARVRTPAGTCQSRDL
jgi:hypothetical protein